MTTHSTRPHGRWEPDPPPSQLRRLLFLPSAGETHPSLCKSADQAPHSPACTPGFPSLAAYLISAVTRGADIKTPRRIQGKSTQEPETASPCKLLFNPAARGGDGVSAGPEAVRWEPPLCRFLRNPVQTNGHEDCHHTLRHFLKTGSQHNLEKEEQIWRTHRCQFQNSLQAFSNQTERGADMKDRHADQ